jgi:hypothetical protein
LVEAAEASPSLKAAHQEIKAAAPAQVLAEPLTLMMVLAYQLEVHFEKDQQAEWFQLAFAVIMTTQGSPALILVAAEGVLLPPLIVVVTELLRACSGFATPENFCRHVAAAQVS